MNVKGPSSENWQTSCCGLCLLTAGNETSDEELDWQINRAKKEAKMKWSRNDRRSGETLMTCVSVPLVELGLEEKLKARGFKVLTEFKRRTGYPQTGNLKLWGLNLI